MPESSGSSLFAAPWLIMGKRILAAMIGGILFGAAGVATASNLLTDSQTDFSLAGMHQFYVWCSGMPSYTATAQGSNAEDAQTSLYNAAKANGRGACWPIWQGRVAN